MSRSGHDRVRMSMSYTAGRWPIGSTSVETVRRPMSTNAAVPFLSQSRRMQVYSWSVLGFPAAAGVTLVTSILGGVLESWSLLGVAFAGAVLSSVMGIVLGALRFNIRCDRCSDPLCARVGLRLVKSEGRPWAPAARCVFNHRARCMNCGQEFVVGPRPVSVRGA